MTGLASLFVLVIIAIIAYNFWLHSLTKNAAPAVRPATRAVLNAYYLSKMTGAYWENELENQARSVMRLKMSDRLDFYRVVILNCKMEATKWMVFAESVKPDAIPLRNDLINRRRAGEFSDDVEKTRANDWIIMLKDIDEAGHGELFGLRAKRLLIERIRLAARIVATGRLPHNPSSFFNH